MCGRFTLTVSEHELRQFLKLQFDDISVKLDHYVPSYNIAPGQQVTALIYDGKSYRLGQMPWGIPIKQNKALNINARSETLMQNTLFKNNIEKRRCIILADGFYEWQNVNNQKKPMYIRFKNHAIFGFAGLYHSINQTKDDKTYGCTIITTEANALLEPIHHRMPVMFGFDGLNHHHDYLITSKDNALKLMKPLKPDPLIMYEVTDRVNKATFNDVEAIKPLSSHA